jgi:hypothetical protein
MNRFSLRFNDELLEVQLARAEDFTDSHEACLLAAVYRDGVLSLPDPARRTELLGRGEEKAVYRVCDSERRVFAVELIDERTYLNGRYVTGAYFRELRVPGVTGVAFAAGSGPFGLRFTGLVKVREYAHGHEWGRFRWRPERTTLVDRPLTSLLRTLLLGRYESYRRRYRDVHERNVLFELRPWRSRGVPMLVRDAAGRLRAVKVGLAPIDLR